MTSISFFSIGSKSMFVLERVLDLSCWQLCSVQFRKMDGKPMIVDVKYFMESLTKGPVQRGVFLHYKKCSTNKVDEAVH